MKLVLVPVQGFHLVGSEITFFFRIQPFCVVRDAFRVILRRSFGSFPSRHNQIAKLVVLGFARNELRTVQIDGLFSDGTIGVIVLIDFLVIELVVGAFPCFFHQIARVVVLHVQTVNHAALSADSHLAQQKSLVVIGIFLTVNQFVGGVEYLNVDLVSAIT